MASSLVLKIWPSEFGLPSLDHECLQFMLCCRIGTAPVIFLKSPSLWAIRAGKLPCLLEDDEIVRIDDFADLVCHLQESVPELSLDSHLSEVEKGNALAYASLLRSNLLPAYLHYVWVDNPNFNTVTNRCYGRFLSFPFGMVYVGRTRSRAKEYLRQLYPDPLMSEDDIAIEVTKKAITCINLLNTKLEDKKYFFGDRPSSLDALIVGYLAPLLKMPLPNDRLQVHLNAMPSLKRYVESTLRIYLPLSDEELTEQQASMQEWEARKARAQALLRKKKPQENTPAADAQDNAFRLRDKILFGLGAAVISLLFAVHFGIIQVEVRSVEKGKRRITAERPIEID